MASVESITALDPKNNISVELPGIYAVSKQYYGSKARLAEDVQKLREKYPKNKFKFVRKGLNKQEVLDKIQKGYAEYLSGSYISR